MAAGLLLALSAKPPFSWFQPFLPAVDTRTQLPGPGPAYQPAVILESCGHLAIHLLGVAQGSLEEAVTIYASHKKGLGFTWELVAIIIINRHQSGPVHPF